MAFSSRRSLVQSVYDPRGPVPSKCGYCKSEDTFFIEAVWGHRMTCRDYQDLVDRGFQRSGKFVYRPIMKETCCPLYVIRTDVTKFKPSKSQRSTMRKLNRFLLQGSPAFKDPNTKQSTPPGDAGCVSEDKAALQSQPDLIPPDEVSCTGTNKHKSPQISVKKRRQVRPGAGPDPLKPPARKAKIIRRERKQKKDEDLPNTSRVCERDMHEYPNTKVSKLDDPSSKIPSLDYPLDQLVCLPDPKDCKHKFETRLVRVNPPSPVYLETRQESFRLFIKFQTTIHQEKEEDCTMGNFEEFIENTPLISTDGIQEMPCGFGTYHQQYLMDGRLFAVGVLDILPRGVLCEYLYYDPGYRFLGPGVYTAISEIALAQQFYRVNPFMQYYYMGFYVQSCPKMNYKSRYSASFLLCPDTHHYVPVEVCIPKLIASGYARLANEEAANVKDSYTQEELDSISVFSLSSLEDPPDVRNMTYQVFRRLYGDVQQSLIEEYVRLVGLEVAERMTLCISSPG